MPLRSLEFCSDPEGCLYPLKTFSLATFAVEISQALCYGSSSTRFIYQVKKIACGAVTSINFIRGLFVSLALV